jgi:hypothetical protein
VSTSGPAAATRTPHAARTDIEDVASRSRIDLATLSRRTTQAPEAEDPRIRGGSHTHRDVTYWPLTRHGPAGGLHAYKIEIHARRRTPPAELPMHEGQISPSNPVRPWSFRRGLRAGSERSTGPSRRSHHSGHTVNGFIGTTDCVLKTPRQTVEPE